MEHYTKGDEVKLRPRELQRRELRRRWAAALRSGRYRQGHDRVSRSHGAHCALEVLYEVFGLWSIRLASKAAGLERSDINGFIALNDDDRLTFDEIAEYVEAL